MRAKGMAFSSFPVSLLAWPVSLKEITWRMYIWDSFQTAMIYFNLETRNSTET
jgi:hypothetical protein